MVNELEELIYEIGQDGLKSEEGMIYSHPKPIANPIILNLKDLDKKEVKKEIAKSLSNLVINIPFVTELNTINSYCLGIPQDNGLTPVQFYKI